MRIDSVNGPEVTSASLAAPQQFRIVRNFDVATIAQACSLTRPILRCATSAMPRELRRAVSFLPKCVTEPLTAGTHPAHGCLPVPTCRGDGVTGIHLYVEDMKRAPTINRGCLRRCMVSSKTLRPAARMSRLLDLLAHLRRERSLRLEAAIGQGIDLGRPSLLRAVAEKG